MEGRQMVKHEYTNASDNLAQYHADQCGRQEVTAEYFYGTLEGSPQLFAWVGDEEAELGLDPWRLIDGPEDARPEWRLFVQKRDLGRYDDRFPVRGTYDAYEPMEAGA